MTHGLKLLIGCFAFAAIAAVWGCWYDNAHPSNRGWTGYITHCEVHGHLPLDEAIKETIRERESSDDRHEREAQEMDQNTDFGSMS